MLNVLIVDDHPSFRRGVKEILNEELSPIKFGKRRMLKKCWSW